MILRYFSHVAEKKLAKELVEKLVKELPPELMENRRKVLSVNKITRLLENSYKIAGGYQKENKIGFIKRAILANTFKWELKNKGFPDDFVDMATEGLVVALAAKKDFLEKK